MDLKQHQQLSSSSSGSGNGANNNNNLTMSSSLPFMMQSATQDTILASRLIRESNSATCGPRFNPWSSHGQESKQETDEESDSEDSSDSDDDSSCDSFSDSFDSLNDDEDDDLNQVKRIKDGEFKYKLDKVRKWMTHGLNPIQQVVALVSLINHNPTIGPGHRTFILNHINVHSGHSRSSSENDDFEKCVQEANSLNFWQQYFVSKSNNPVSGDILDLLLKYLPLVHVPDIVVNAPGDSNCDGNDAVDVTPLNILYLHLITSVLSKVTSLKLQPASRTLLDKSRQLLSLALVSRVFTSSQKVELSRFMAKLILQLKASSNAHTASSSLPNSFSPFHHSHHQSSSTSSSSHQPLDRIGERNSSFGSSILEQQQLSSSNNNSGFERFEQSSHQQSDADQLKMQLMYSQLASDVSKSRPETSVTTSDPPEMVRSPFSGIGMSGIPGYLKSLRLHKYTELFQFLPSINVFMNLSDSDLERLGVAAKGARKKFLQHLDKLRSRPEFLSSLFNISGEGSVAEIISGVTSVLSSPLYKESNETNLILHLLLKLKNENMSLRDQSSFFELIDKCCQQPIWTREQQRVLMQLKDQSVVPLKSSSGSNSFPLSPPSSTIGHFNNNNSSNQDSSSNPWKQN